MSLKPIKKGMMTAPPGEFIREEILLPLGLSISKAARVMKMRRATLSEIVNDKSRLTPDVALRLERAFGVSMELLLRMQGSYEIAQTRQRAGEIDVERYKPEMG